MPIPPADADRGFFARNRVLVTLLAWAILLTAAPAARADRAAAVSDGISRAIAAHPVKGASISVQVVALGQTPQDQQVLYSRSAGRPMIPASNLKLLTTAAALETLGHEFHFRTQLLVRGDAASGEVELAVIGDGDPTFGDAELLKGIAGWDTRTVFTSWATLLRQQGVTRISTIRLDDSVFDQEHVHASWPLNQRHRWYEAQVGGLNLNINCLDVHVFRRGGETAMGYRLDPPTRYATVENTLRTGSKNAVVLTRPEGTNRILLGGTTNAREQGPLQVTIDNPTAYFGAVFAEVLREQGIDCGEAIQDRTIRQEWESRSTPPVDTDAAEMAGATDDPAGIAPWRALAVHETEMATVLARTNKDSINLYAEALAKRLAHTATGDPGSWAAAEGVVKAYLERLGSDPDPIRMADGSGMSRESRVTAQSLCAVLAAMHHHAAADLFRSSLSEAGEDGTLQRRFGDKSRQGLRGRVFGKTGYISGVCTFSGYLHGRDGRWYAFSILVNDSNDLARAQQLQEEIVAAVDRSVAP
jgi:D-alanyl-D-alanine carboxypeptidase/D-alanyl-D-alanine-endopeptidase (penicillin-binding protein 4)